MLCGVDEERITTVADISLTIEHGRRLTRIHQTHDLCSSWFAAISKAPLSTTDSPN